MFENYILENHEQDLIKILEDSRCEKHFSMIINFVKLFETNTELANTLVNKPINTLIQFDQSIVTAQQQLIEENSGNNFKEKSHVHARISGLVTFPELHRTIFPDCDDLWSFLEVSGTVIRITTPKLLEYQRQYICRKCKYITTVEADYVQRFIIQAPKKCANPDEECNGKNILPVKSLEHDNCKDYQEIKLQEQISKLCIGSIPTSMWITLEDDLVDSCKPGDDVTICGIVMRRWKPQCNGKKLDVEIVLRANYVQVNNDQRSITLVTSEIKEQFRNFWESHKEQPLIGRDTILKSFCPQLYGLYFAKLAVAVIIAGGSRNEKSSDTGTKIRSEPHLLLVGDPGTGKSHLLRFASKIIPRSVLTTGIGSTSAGLTVTAVMESGEWQLEAGALVLADGGICCIDEFNSMKEHDRASIHEAMEQQTISVAKASVVCKLSTRCSILAATNPKGHFDPLEPLSLNVVLASPLLSRFDLILLLRDAVDYQWDEYVCSHIFETQIIGSNKKGTVNSWNLETLQAYYIVIKGLQPKLTDDANLILSTYYQAQRQAPSRNVARTTVRLLDSLVRLSQAHARLMFRSEVVVMDAIVAIILIESSVQGAALLLPSDLYTIRTPFPDEPTKSYCHLAKLILEKLQLGDIMNAELKKWQYFINNDHAEANTSADKDDSEEKKNVVIDISLTQIRKRNNFERNIILKTKAYNKDLPNNQILIQNSSKNIDKTKRKNDSNEPKEINKKNKISHKLNTNLQNNKINDLELLNLIPSVNDIYKLNENEDIIETQTFDTFSNQKVISDTMSYTQKRKNEFEKKMNTLKEKFGFQSKKKSPVKPEINNKNIEKFSCNENENNMQIHHNSDLDTKNVKDIQTNSDTDSQSQLSQISVKTLFQSPDDDIDNLDLDL